MKFTSVSFDTYWISFYIAFSLNYNVRKFQSNNLFESLTIINPYIIFLFLVLLLLLLIYKVWINSLKFLTRIWIHIISIMYIYIICIVLYIQNFSFKRSGRYHHTNAASGHHAERSRRVNMGCKLVRHGARGVHKFRYRAPTNTKTQRFSSRQAARQASNVV